MEFFKKFVLENIIYILSRNYHIIKIENDDNYYGGNHLMTLSFVYPKHIKNNYLYFREDAIKNLLDLYVEETKGAAYEITDNGIFMKINYPVNYVWPKYKSNSSDDHSAIILTENITELTMYDFYRCFMRSIDYNVKSCLLNLNTYPHDFINTFDGDVNQRNHNTLIGFDAALKDDIITLSTGVTNYELHGLEMLFSHQIVHKSYGNDYVINSGCYSILKMFGYTIDIERKPIDKETELQHYSTFNFTEPRKDYILTIKCKINQSINMEKLKGVMLDSELKKVAMEHYTNNPLKIITDDTL